MSNRTIDRHKVPGFIAGLVLMSLPIYYPTIVLADWYQQQHDVMGTRVSVEFWQDETVNASACANAVFTEMRRIDALMSPYHQNSELSYINNNATVSAIRISDEMARLIDKSLYFSRLSAGAFDITYASVGYAYDYRQRHQPDSEFIAALLPAIDYRHIKLADQTIRFERSGVRIDLGGIAKGYAVDRSIEILKQCGVNQAMVSAGGDSRIIGDRHGRPWIIGIQHPRNPRAVALVLPLSNSAVSTSGDYERFFIDRGQRIHHIIDPKTGRSATASWSVTVTGPDAMTTDALSTTIFVLGPIRGLALIETLAGIDAIIIDNQGQLHYSSGLQPPTPAPENS